MAEWNLQNFEARFQKELGADYKTKDLDLIQDLLRSRMPVEMSW